eukprot:7246560-Prorocentrum_lima.AAC.1
MDQRRERPCQRVNETCSSDHLEDTFDERKHGNTLRSPPVSGVERRDCKHGDQESQPRKGRAPGGR